MLCAAYPAGPFFLFIFLAEYNFVIVVEVRRRGPVIVSRGIALCKSYY